MKINNRGEERNLKINGRKCPLVTSKEVEGHKTMKDEKRESRET